MTDKSMVGISPSRISHLAAFAVLLVLAPQAVAQYGATNGQWRAYAADNGSTKYSSLDQINADNIDQVEVAWQWKSVEDSIVAANPKLRIRYATMECTPLMVGDTLYAVTPMNVAVALNPRTGGLIWKFDPECYKRTPRGGPNKGFIHRGAAYWTDGIEERILYATTDARLYALDAKTGKQCIDFGSGGHVDLTKGLRRRIGLRGYGVNSPPVICRDVVAVGSTIGDYPGRSTAPGDVRGFNVRTGELVWNFHTIPQQGEFGVETWEDNSWKYTGSANVWPPFSADEELGYFYLPVSTPSNDYYGGDRPGDGLFGESLVCINATTGERVWHFQMVHHGLWDYDLPCAPNLVDITVDGLRIRAVAQLSKQGFCYVFDRATGTPVWPIEERPVPASTVPGEKTSPTQPFPSKPPAFERQGISPDDLVDYTPELKAEALEILNKYDHGPLFTPPSQRGTISVPGWGGGADWQGGAFDPDSGMLYLSSMAWPSLFKLGKPDPARSDAGYTIAGRINMNSKTEMSILKGPMTHVTAIDLNKGEIAWRVPHWAPPKNLDDLPDKTKALIDNPAAKIDWDHAGWAPAIYSPGMVTKSLVFFGVGRSSTERSLAKPLFQAYDKRTGEIVWEIELPTNTTGGPMTYMSGGKQYIVVGIGGRGDYTPAFIALSLP